MKNKNETGGKLFCFVIFVKQPHDNTLNCFKEKRKKFSVFKEEVSEFRINGKDTVSVLNIDYLKRHRGSAVNGVFVSTGWAKTAVTPKRNKFKGTAR